MKKVSVLSKIIKIIRLQTIREWLHHYSISVSVCHGKGTYFHIESNVINAQGNASLIEIGNFTHVRGELFIFGHGGKIRIGDYCYIGEGTKIWSGAQITIGNNVLIAHNVNIHDNNSHPINKDSRRWQTQEIFFKGHPQHIDLNDKPVIINDDVWIGYNASIFKGVQIGKEAVIGACSVVTKDVPDYAIVVGNPARIIGYSNDPKYT